MKFLFLALFLFVGCTSSVAPIPVIVDPLKLDKCTKIEQKAFEKVSSEIYINSWLKHHPGAVILSSVNIAPGAGVIVTFCMSTE